MLDLYNEQMREMTAHAVCIRQEEHKKFLPIVRDQGVLLAKLRTEDVIPHDTHIAVDAIGALPYYSDLRTLDRLGLTDRVVARSPARRAGERYMAHDRAATIEYAAACQVDLWAPDHTELIYGGDDPRLIEFSQKEHSLGIPLYVAALDSSQVLAAFLPTPYDIRRFPKLKPALVFFQERTTDADPPWWAFANLGALLVEKDDLASARSAYERALTLNPAAAHVRELLAALFIDVGDTTSALSHAQQALVLRPDDVGLRLSLVRGLAEAGRYEEAFDLLQEGLARKPGNISLWIPLARLYLACPDERFRNPTEALRIAKQLRIATRGQDADVLATLVAAHEALGHVVDAQQAAREAAAVARSQGNTALADAM